MDTLHKVQFVTIIKRGRQTYIEAKSWCLIEITLEII